MNSKKEEERNEKIIRGLMKLPPNRRCINCNSLGPQYVCTNFWTFVCITCSGIHREFTHRVKSVSMSKFTSQEVEALQEGGNQRAREAFLKDWDSRTQIFPDSSNADKVRLFIKCVYVDGKYSGAKTAGRPPRDIQNLRNQEHETRRASSYHSYSQSPPYDYQYEERRYGKQAPALTRKPGSDRGNYGRKLFSFLSPSRLSDHVQEDRFANEVPNARVSDYSVSSRSDPARSATQSPNFQRDTEFSSPSSEKSRDILSEDVQQYKVNEFSNTNGKRDADQASHAQRTASSGSFGSFNSRAMSFDSVDSVDEKYIAPAPEKLMETNHTIVPTFPSLPQSSGFGMSDGLELFSAPFIHQTITSTASAIDLFQLPQASSTLGVDISQPSPISMIPTSDSHQQSQNFPPSSLDFLPLMPHLESAETLKDKSPDLVQKNEGWATFDVSSHVEPSQGIESLIPTTVCSSNSESLGKFDQLSSSNTSSYWSPYQDLSASGPSSMHNQQHEDLHSVEAPFNATSNNSWSLFEDNNVTFQSVHEQSSRQVAVEDHSVADQYLVWGLSEDLQNSQVQRAALDTRHPIVSTSSHAIGSSDASFALPIMEEAHSRGSDRKSRNPFDLPCDSDFESSKMFLDMSSFEAALPNHTMSNSFISSNTQPWFPQSTAVPYTPNGPQDTLGFMAGEAPSMQIPNNPSQGPVASIGRNPFG